MEHSAPLGQRTRLLLQGGAVPFRLSPFEVIVLLAVLAATMFGGYQVYARTTDLNKAVAAPPTFIPAFRQTLTSNVSTTGTVIASQQVTLTFGTTGKIKEFLVGLGAQVTAGQALARIDDSDLQQTVKSAQSNLDSAVARYNAATQGPQNTDILSAQQAVNSAKSQLATAQQNLADLKAKPLPADTAKAQQGLLTAQNAQQSAQDAITKAQTDALNAEADYNIALAAVGDKLSKAQQDWQSLSTAYAACIPNGVSLPGLPPMPGAKIQPTNATSFVTGACTVPTAATNYNQAVSAYNLSAAAFGTALTTVTTKLTAWNAGQATVNSGNLQRALQNAQIGVQTAQQTVIDTAVGAKQSDLDAAQRSVDAAQSSVDLATAKYSALFDPPKPENLLPLQASVDQAKATLSTAQLNLVAATITAPFAGQISSLTGEVGSQVGANTTVFILLNPKLIRIDANVDQSDISNLKVGQNSSITFDALTGRTYTGTVSAIGLTPTTTQGVVTYVVSFAIDTAALPATTPVPTPGMTGSIAVTTSRVDNALVVATRAIKTVARTRTVTVKTATGTEERTITVGTVSGNLTQVVTGLNEGDLVQVATGSTAATTPARTTTTPNQFGGGGGGGFQIPGGR